MLQFSHMVLSAFQKQPPCNQQLIHHNWWIQLPWPSLSLPIWWPAEDWWADHHRVKEDTIFALTLWHLKFVYDLLDDICPLFFSSSPLLNDGMENYKWGLILKYQFSQKLNHHLQVICLLCWSSEILFTPAIYLQYDLTMCKILVLYFSFRSYWVSSPCLNKHCSALMT